MTDWPLARISKQLSAEGYLSGQLTLNGPWPAARMVPTKQVRWTPCQTPSRRGSPCAVQFAFRPRLGGTTYCDRSCAKAPSNNRIGAVRKA